MRKLDERLQPMAHRPVDINKPDWLKELSTSPPPLDQAGIRPEAEAFLMEIVDYYGRASAHRRAEIRSLFEKFKAFAWAATLPHSIASPETFREHLIHFSIIDQGLDFRDAILWLRDICVRGAKAGVSLQPILKEVATLSSDVDKYGMGSTKSQLIGAS